MKRIIEKYNNLTIIAKASLWFLICSFVQKGISIITTPIFTRLLTTSEFGKLNVFNSWEYLFNVFVSLCLSAGVYQQGLVKYEEDKNNFTSSMQGLTLCITLIWSIIFIVFKKIFNTITGFNTIYILLMVIIIWTNNVFAFWANEQKVQFKYKKLIVISIIASILNPIIGIFLIKYMNDKVLARILGIVLIGLIFYCPLFFFQIKKGNGLYNKKYWKYALMYNLPLIPHYLSQIVLSSSDRIMIDKLIGTDAAGIYSLAYSIALIMTLFNNSLMQTITPWMYKNIKNHKIDGIKKVGYFSLIIVAVVNLILITMAPEAIKIFAPIEYYEAIYVIPPVAMSVYFMYMYDLFAKFAFYYEKTKSISLTTLIGAISNLILNLIFIKKFGYIAAAYTTLVCYIIYSVCHYVIMSKICKNENIENPFNVQKILIISFSFLLLGFVFNLLYSTIYVRYILVIIIALLMLIYKNKIVSIVRLIKS